MDRSAVYLAASQSIRSPSSTNSCRGVTLKFQRNRDIRPEIGRRRRTITFERRVEHAIKTFVGSTMSVRVVEPEILERSLENAKRVLDLHAKD